MNPFLENLARKSKTTQDTYSFIIAKYLSVTPKSDIFQENSAKLFLENAAKEKVSNTSLYVYHNALKFFFKSYDRPFKIFPPKISIYNQRHPSLRKEDIEKIILSTRTCGLPNQQAYLAISTTYGLRKSELSAISDIDIKNDKIFIRTVKGGQQRWHIIPEQIKMYITKYRFYEIPQWTMHLLFKQICNLAGLNLCKEDKGWWGWHSIRRSLIKELNNSFPDKLKLANFMRYNTSNYSILDRYSRLDGDDQELINLDLELFAVHPFLSFWC